MIDLEYQFYKTKKELRLLTDFVNYYMIDNKQALKCLDKAETELIKAGQHVKDYNTDTATHEKE